MPIRVLIPTALRQYAQGRDTIELDGANVGQIMTRLSEQFPDLRRHLFSDDGTLRNFVNVFVNDENIRDRESVETVVNPGDELAIVPAVAGGCLLRRFV